MKLNSRYELETSPYDKDTFRVVDLYQNAQVGQFHKVSGEIWGFVLGNGRERTGGYRALLGTLKRTLSVGGRSIPKFS